MFGRRTSKTLTLSPLNRWTPLARYRDVRHLDVWEPTDFPTAPYPERAHVLNAVSQRIEALISSDAVDADLGHIADAEIDAWHAQWLSQVSYDLEGKLRVLDQLRAASHQELTRRQRMDDTAQQERAQAARSHDSARSAYFASPVKSEHADG
jgi:hypothetical protein